MKNIIYSLVMVMAVMVSGNTEAANDINRGDDFDVYENSISEPLNMEKRYAVAIHCGPLGTFGFEFEWGLASPNGDPIVTGDINGTIVNGNLQITKDAAFNRVFGNVTSVTFPASTLLPTRGSTGTVSSINVIAGTYNVVGGKMTVSSSTVYKQ
jgi:hypothetical protein